MAVIHWYLVPIHKTLGTFPEGKRPHKDLLRCCLCEERLAKIHQEIRDDCVDQDQDEQDNNRRQIESRPEEGARHPFADAAENGFGDLMDHPDDRIVGIWPNPAHNHRNHDDKRVDANNQMQHLRNSYK